MRVGADGTFGINLQRAKQPSSSGHTPITVLNVDAESPNAPVLRSGDELISVAGENIRGNYDALMAQLRKHKPSGAIRCEVVRPHLSALELGASAASGASASACIAFARRMGSKRGWPSAAKRSVAPWLLRRCSSGVSADSLGAIAAVRRAWVHIGLQPPSHRVAASLA